MPYEVVIVVDNTAGGPGLVGEHGLSILVRTPRAHLLFDTGADKALAHNANALGLSLDLVDAVILSHGHYDQAGGLPDVLDSSRPKTVYMHPDALRPRFVRQDSPPPRAIGLPERSHAALNGMMDRVHWTLQPCHVRSGVRATGPIPRWTSFEDTGGAFCLDPECATDDPISDDQAVWFETQRGVVVLLGCAHAGVVNTLYYVAEVAGTSRFHAVIGGMHLLTADEQRLRATANALEHYHVEVVAPCHCTGETATAYLAERLGKHCVPCKVGTRFVFR
jgi:7,8-dihydropterin-6-yl-methyl-4-(beta-D-ribofuranosyl)aminobenzene 5'-phosphate synthase